MTKKILYVITKSTWGGAQRYVFDLATNLVRDRVEIAVACGGSGELVMRLERAGVRVIRIPELGRDIAFISDLASFISLTRIFMRERPDVVHLSSSKVGGLGAVAARIASWATGHKVTVVFTVHGWAFFEDRSLIWRSIVFLGSWFSSLFQDSVVLIDERDMRAARYFIPDTKLRLIYLGIRPGAGLGRAEARAVLTEKIARAIDQNEIIIGTIAELTPTKGLAYLIEAARLLREKNTRPFLVIIIGAGEDEVMLREMIRGQGLETHVFLIGQIPDAAHLLRGFDIFTLPSVKEGLPYVLLEAMMAGIPAVATNVGGIPDLIDHGRTGVLVQPKNPQKLAGALSTLIEHPELRTKLPEQWQQAQTRFSFERMIELTERAYRIP